MEHPVNVGVPPIRRGGTHQEHQPQDVEARIGTVPLLPQGSLVRIVGRLKAPLADRFVGPQSLAAQRPAETALEIGILRLQLHRGLIRGNRVLQSVGAAFRHAVENQSALTMQVGGGGEALQPFVGGVQCGAVVLMQPQRLGELHAGLDGVGIVEHRLSHMLQPRGEIGGLTGHVQQRFDPNAGDSLPAIPGHHLEIQHVEDRAVGPLRRS